jgi:hypothetical protein
MKLLHTIGLVTGMAALTAASVLSACSSSSSSGTTPGVDAGQTPDGNTGNPDSPMGNPDTGNAVDAGSNPETGAMPSCASYCSTILANCTGTNAQYITLGNKTMSDTCLAMCAKFPVGTAADRSGDTLGCRFYHAGAAAGDPVLHCPHAGPTGAGTCSVSTCEAFCALDLAQCAGVYPDQGTCMTDCNAYATVDAGEIATTSGNTLNCRVYHLEAAYDDPATHCPHTGPSVAGGSSPCN